MVMILSDGTNTPSIRLLTQQLVKLEVTNNVDNTVETIDFSKVSSYDSSL